ncbi:MULTISPECIES: orotidine-5'-phosphate decarboxylase [Alteromonas]|jgi:orotidine-5'-phosphate decarboxylase|uniref:Orotidine 5'-phosphate decarboxylase n=1 Tax=Alteromonas stellipolaris TaxID=233316 RepID=A0AAW7YW83_9ALTE|nr:orotidine-5'-phosphate decarboxylase [Alteromonas stellipolaris]ALM90638.1 Orotidine 5'-phosphate decarboxylase [Alteromonas stellipolaris LMG 21856]AMJ73701.1 orotidine 5'-phosphate decarboxylase [Alteromonas stellipolaris]ANB22528.1 orotidine 5'-phosphate decarboxylase [Alteromonas stellipolaris]ANB27163.1 orotidine 5'-phosphate decarboxylase [Alteromonas stellipolaris]MBZ2162436.1 orotidine-5'-phosphate decarboxylase [Alteromonas stellipolaris]
MQEPRVIVALDYDNQEQALSFVDQLDPNLCKVKVGKEMFTLFGPEFVKSLVAKGFDVFLDLKFHDIPNTVGKACKAAAELGVWMVNVHASGGLPMMQAAKEGIAQSSRPETKLIAVTVLTSMDQSQLSGVIDNVTPEQQVLRLASLTAQAGLDGVVCSAKEAVMLRNEIGEDFLLVTPGIRPKGSDAGDQKRVMTPPEAIDSGVSYLVMGRPITQASEPMEVLKQVNASIS